MRKFIPAIVAAMFAAATFSAYAADEGTQPPPQEQKDAKKKAPAVEQGAPQAQGRGDPSGAAAGGAVQQGAPQAQGRGDPTGAPAAGGGAVTSPTPTGPGRADNQ